MQRQKFQLSAPNKSIKVMPNNFSQRCRSPEANLTLSKIDTQKSFFKNQIKQALKELTDQQMQQFLQDVTPVNCKSNIQDMIECQICMNLLHEPVECAECQTAFCGLCIKDWKTRNGQYVTCPNCRCENPEYKKAHRNVHNLLN